MLRLFGWKITGTLPAVPQYIVIVVPHTSWVDFPIGLLTRASLEQNIRFAGKNSLFKPPFGWIFRMLGGYPVDRSKRNNLVDAIVDIFQKEADFKQAVTNQKNKLNGNK